MIGETLFAQWRIDSDLASGSFSQVYAGTDLTTLEPVAIKVLKPEASHLMFESEIRTLALLQDCTSNEHAGVPRLLFSSSQPAVLVFQRVGSTLLNLFKEANFMSYKSILMVGLQMLGALEDIHSLGVIHKDIKPDNIAIGINRAEGELYLLDFGLSAEFMHHQIHVPYCENWEFQGTPYFSSVNSLKGVRPSRRDDLESLGYVLLFISQGTLPWLEVAVSSPSDLINMLKARSKLEAFLQSAPSFFGSYFAYVSSLLYDQKPDYGYLRRLIESELEANSLVCDWVFDWTPLSYRKPTRAHSNSLRRNMSLLSSNDSPSPGEKISLLRRRSTETSDFSSTPTHAPALDGARLRRFSKC